MGISDTNLGITNIGTSSIPAIVDLAKQGAMVSKTLPVGMSKTLATGLSSVIEQQERTQRVFANPMLDVIQAQQNLFTNAMAAFEPPKITIPTVDIMAQMGQVLEASIPKFDFVEPLTKMLDACMPKFDIIGEAVLRLADNIPKIDLAVNSIMQQAANVMCGIAASVQKSIDVLLDAASRIDFSALANFSDGLFFITDFDKKNEVLKGFGWYLISELPEEIVNEIYEHREEITQEEVDALIVQHFRNDEGAALKSIVNSWTTLPYFESRMKIFLQAADCHSSCLYNASTTTVSVHYEGIVTDFVRGRIMAPTHRKWAEKALKCINDLTNELTINAMPYKEWLACTYVLECMDRVFKENFSPDSPDDCSNSSRHKIAHGHALEDETEANSLRCFLFLNVMYKLFGCLESAMVGAI